MRLRTAVGRQKLSVASFTHAHLDVGYLVGRSGRSSGWRGAKGPPPVGTADLVVDIAKSVSRAPWSVPATPCLLCKAYGLAISLRSSHGANRISGRWW